MRELVQLAEQGGFEIAWAAEHHTIELMAGPNPFTFLMDWAAHTWRIRLGTAVVGAPYWHPIRVAGEAALVDLYSDGRLELGLGRGSMRILGVSCGGYSCTSGVVVGKAWVPPLEQWPERAIERASSGL